MEQMENLSQCTSVYAFGFFSHGHVDDSSIPEMVESSGNPLEFVTEVYHIDPHDMDRKFEQGTVAKGQSKPSPWPCWLKLHIDFHQDSVERETRNSLKKEVGTAILAGLCVSFKSTSL